MSSSLGECMQDGGHPVHRRACMHSCDAAARRYGSSMANKGRERASERVSEWSGSLRRATTFKSEVMRHYLSCWHECSLPEFFLVRQEVYAHTACEGPFLRHASSVNLRGRCDALLCWGHHDLVCCRHVRRCMCVPTKRQGGRSVMDERSV